MTQEPLGVAVIGVGMVGRAHAAGYRTAAGLFDINDRPDTRLVAIADAYEPFAVDAAKRFGYERSETSWQAIVDAPDVDVVSVAVANSMHREVVEALLAAGKHVLCEKPLAPSVEDAKAMVAAAEAATTHAGVGFTFRRAPGINAIREQILEGAIGDVRHFNGHYWCDYAQNPNNPISWRYKGGPGSGALADIGSHMIDLGEYVCGPMTSVSGAVFQTFTTERPVPVGVTVGHGAGEVSDEKETVDNEDIATFAATFANGSVGTFSISRVAHGLPNGLGFEVFAEKGSAAYDLNRPGEFTYADQGPAGVVNGPRQVLLGPDHPYLQRGLPMDFPSVGHGQNDFFAWQARAFLDQVAGLDRLPAVPTLRHGLHNMEILAAVTQSALNNGQSVSLA
jgi:predicted dehydrogenase